MDSLVPRTVPIAIVAVLLLAVEVGYWIGKRRMRSLPAGQRIETGSVQGAMLGLLGLLLGFSFAGASSRFIERQDLIVREANAIGTAYRRAELLGEPQAGELKSALLAYLSQRVEISRTMSSSLSAKDARAVAEDQDRIWAAAREGVELKPAATVVVISSVNDVLDLHDYRMAAGRKHLPFLVLGLLAVCSVLTLAVMGYASALTRERNTLMVSAIAVLVAALLWTTVDLDWSRIGVIRVSDAPLQDLLTSLSGPGHSH
jgi:hypothetical protein